MSRHPRIIPMAASLVLMGFLAATRLPAGTPAPQPDAVQPTAEEVVPSPGASLIALGDVEAERLSPLMQEMRGILLQEAADLATMIVQADSEEERFAVLDLQRQISNRKFQTRIELLAAQERHARLAGSTELADEAAAKAGRMKAQLESLQTDKGVR